MNNYLKRIFEYRTANEIFAAQVYLALYDRQLDLQFLYRRLIICLHIFCIYGTLAVQADLFKPRVGKPTLFNYFIEKRSFTALFWRR